MESLPPGSVPMATGPKEQIPLGSNDGPIKQFMAAAKAKKRAYEFDDDDGVIELLKRKLLKR